MNKRLEISVEFNEEGEKKKEKRGKGRKIANSRAFFLSSRKRESQGGDRLFANFPSLFDLERFTARLHFDEPFIHRHIVN